MLNHASAGEYAEFTVIEAGAPYIEMALVILITNARYLLMSCALSQRFAPDAPLIHRVLVGFGITDEIFGISIARPGNVNPFYTYGAMALALPAWSSATAIGIVAGNILPASVVSALSVALYGMFLAIVIPPTKKNKILGGVVLISFVFSGLFTWLPVTKNFVCKYENYNLDNCNRRSSRSIVSSEGRKRTKGGKKRCSIIFICISWCLRLYPLPCARCRLH